MPTEYKTLYIDPPWNECGGGKIKRGADRHYKLMKVKDIIRTIWTCPIFNPADDAHLYLWTTNTYVIQAGAVVMPQLGFRYVTKTTWVKLADDSVMKTLRKLAEKHGRGGTVESLAGSFSAIEIAEAVLQIGLGQYQRGSDEALLFGVRGKAMVPEPEDRLPSVVFAPRGKHSAKPEVFYDRIERVSPGPRAEIFARSRRDGWDSFGDQLPQNDA